MYIFNHYDPCVTNKTIEKKQHVVCFHVDDLMASDVLPKVNDWFDVWLNTMHGHCGMVKCIHGKNYDYLGMTFDFLIPSQVKFQMFDCVANMIDKFPVHLSKDDVLPTPGCFGSRCLSPVSPSPPGRG